MDTLNIPSYQMNSTNIPFIVDEDEDEEEVGYIVDYGYPEISEDEDEKDDGEEEAKPKAL